MIRTRYHHVETRFVFVSPFVVVVFVPESVAVIRVIVCGSFGPRSDRVNVVDEGLTLQAKIPSMDKFWIVTGFHVHVIDVDVIVDGVTVIVADAGIMRRLITSKR
jgi:hypothetical protein